MPSAIDVGEELNHGLTRSQWSSRVKKGYVEKFLRLPGEREEAALAEMPSAPAVARVSDAAEALSDHMLQTAVQRSQHGVK